MEPALLRRVSLRGSSTGMWETDCGANRIRICWQSSRVERITDTEIQHGALPGAAIKDTVDAE